MKLRVSDTDIVITDRLDFVEIDGESIFFHFGDKTHQSIFNNDLESQCVFNNMNACMVVTDVRFETREAKATEDERKEKGFEMFWSLYDKRVDKGRARKAFMNMPLKDMYAAVEGVKAYVDSTPDKKYRKMPTTWLNNKGWESEIKVDKKATNRYVKPKYIDDER